MAGLKHQQEDQERRLSSAGAITPIDTSGRKKQRNVEGAGTEHTEAEKSVALQKPLGGRSLGKTSQGRSKLKADPEGISLNAYTELDKVSQIGESLHGSREKSWSGVKRKIRTMRMGTLYELKGRPLRRLVAADRLGFLPDDTRDREGPLTRATTFIMEQVQASSVGGMNITDSNLWRWDSRLENGRLNSWRRTNSEWKTVIRPESTLRARYNTSWGLIWDTGKWENLWRQLWRAKIFPRDKLWLWRIINKGCFTQERASAMEVAGPLCTMCQEKTENIEHMFLQCRKVRHNWQLLSNLHTVVTGVEEFSATSLIMSLEKLLTLAYSALLVIFIVFSRFVWRDRCNEVFERGPRSTPAKVILQEAELIAVGLAKRTASIDVQEKLEKTASDISKLRAFHQRAITARIQDGPHEEEGGRWYSSQGTRTSIGEEERRMCRRTVWEGHRIRERTNTELSRSSLPTD
ncbi:hypothetical protein R1sor_022806 [Riccia sorocarpa]|uniref:Reverse transcriptase zinc-binding domain-containing protein n=1 Tax=Riccia sorocarpa TaxID=122646 RepID=A0ABD3GP35_9MARC